MGEKSLNGQPRTGSRFDPMRSSSTSMRGGFETPRPVGRVAQVDRRAITRSHTPTPTVPKPPAAQPAPSSSLSAPKPPPVTRAGTTAVNGIKVVILPDDIGNATGGAHTGLHFTRGVPDYEYSGPKKIITKLGPRVVIEATIQTSYSPGAKPSNPSAYGRGTTAEDKRNGNVSLGFHESCHRTDYTGYINAHTPPVFSGKIGLSKDEYELASEEYFKAVDEYLAKCLKFSEDQTDEVGSPTKTEYFAKHK